MAAKVRRAKNPRFDVYLDYRKEWRWTLYAKNGEIIASGEGYGSEKDVRRAVRAVQRAVLRTIDSDWLIREGASR